MSPTKYSSKYLNFCLSSSNCAVIFAIDFFYFLVRGVVIYSIMSYF